MSDQGGAAARLHNPKNTASKPLGIKNLNFTYQMIIAIEDGDEEPNTSGETKKKALRKIYICI